MVLTSPPAPQPSRPGEDGDGAAVDAYEEAHVHGVYEAIAPHFSATRHKPWPLVSSFLASRAPGSVGLDVGCGNGKNMGVNRDVVMLGCDRSAALVALARDSWCGTRYRRRRRRGRGDMDVDVDAAATAAAEGSGSGPGLGPGGADDNDDDDGTGVAIPGADVAVADSLVLPFREASADFAICIAVIHHLSTRERRVDAIRQLLRCIRRGHQGGGGGDDDNDGGKVLVYVWALEQRSSRRGWDEGGEQDLLVPWVMKAPPQKKEKKEKKNKEKKQATRGQKQGERNGQGQGQVQAQVQASGHDAAEKNSLDRPGGAAGTRSSDSPRAADQPGGGEGGEKLQGDDDHHIQHQHGHGNARQQQQQQGRGSEAGADAAATAPAGTAGNDRDSSSKQQQGDRHADKTFHRYYHLYRKGELEDEVISAGGKVIKSGYERDNWWVIAG